MVTELVTVIFSTCNGKIDHITTSSASHERWILDWAGSSQRQARGSQCVCRCCRRSRRREWEQGAAGEQECARSRTALCASKNMSSAGTPADWKLSCARWCARSPGGGVTSGWRGGLVLARNLGGEDSIVDQAAEQQGWWNVGHRGADSGRQAGRVRALHFIESREGVGKALVSGRQSVLLRQSADFIRSWDQTPFEWRLPEAFAAIGPGSTRRRSLHPCVARPCTAGSQWRENHSSRRGRSRWRSASVTVAPRGNSTEGMRQLTGRPGTALQREAEVRASASDH